MKKIAVVLIAGILVLVTACGGAATESRTQDKETAPTGSSTSNGFAYDQFRGTGGPPGAVGPAGPAGPSGSTGGAAPAPMATRAPMATGTPAPRAPGDPSLSALTALSQTDSRKIISNATVSLEVADVQPAIAQVRTIAEGMGGFVQQLSSAGDPEHQQANLTVRVPQPQFFDALDRIKGLGKLMGQNVGSNDVSEQYVDLQARLKSSQREEESYLTLLGKAQSVSDVLTIERELARVRGEIERFQGQLNYLERQVALATISVSLQPPAKDIVKPPAASLTIAAKNVSRSLDEIKGMVGTVQGVVDSSVLTTKDGQEQASISFRVFTQDFGSALSSVESKGEVQSKELREGGDIPQANQERTGKPNAPIQVTIVEKHPFPVWAIVLTVVLPILFLVGVGTAIYTLVHAGNRRPKHA